MNNIEMLINNKKYNEEYTVAKAYYEILQNKMKIYMKLPLTDDVCPPIIQLEVGVDNVIDYYKELRLLYEKYRELVLNCYHFDFIRNGNAMKFLNKFIEYMLEIEKIMTYYLDIDTKGECML